MILCHLDGRRWFQPLRYFGPVDQSVQMFAYVSDANEIERKATHLKDGQSFTKQFYFFVETKATYANGYTGFSSGGSYLLGLTWTRQNGVLSFRMSVR